LWKREGDESIAVWRKQRVQGQKAKGRGKDLSIHLMLYSKPGCHLCEGLQEKLMEIQSLDFELEVRDITTRDDWFQTYQYEIPVLVLEKRQEAGGRRQEAGEAEGDREPQRRGGAEFQAGNASSAETPSSFIPYPLSFISLPRPSPRATVQQLEQMLRKYL
jgi:hypothetical protein